MQEKEKEVIFSSVSVRRMWPWFRERRFSFCTVACHPKRSNLHRLSISGAAGDFNSSYVESLSLVWSLENHCASKCAWSRKAESKCSSISRQ